MLFCVCTIAVQAQNSFTLYYTTELENNLKGQTQWVNLFEVEGSIKLWRGASFDFLTQSIYQTRKESIVDDMMTFSNIYAYNQPISPFVMGVSQQVGKLKLFFGLRNINEDYFTYPYTSIYTNSSCGIYPTISVNYPQSANYPLSALALHLEYDLSDKWSIKNTLYNGVARPISDGWSIFDIAPVRDGLFNITELKYTHKRGVATVGGAYYTKENNYALWANCEYDFAKWGDRKIGGLLQGSFAPASKNLCNNYVGVGFVATGLVLSKTADQIAVIYNRGAFTNMDESTVEITWMCPLSKNFSLQPAYHLIKTGSMINNVAMLRVNYKLNANKHIIKNRNYS